MIYETRQTTFECDLVGPDCTGAFRVKSWSFTHNRKQARAAGWRLGKSWHYCPNCKKKASQRRGTIR